LSFLAAFFQALSALLLVAIVVGVFNATGIARRTTEAWLETASWAIVVLIGVWLLWTQLRKLIGARTTAVAAEHHHHHHADHSHGHAHAHGHAHGHADAHAGGHAHDRHDGHDHTDCCGHAHMPDPKDLEGAWSWRKAVPLALAIGIRPCTGAIAVLIFALSQGLVWAGVFATFAMAVGTAITVSALAVLAVGSRDLAVWLGGGQGGWGTHVRTAVGIGGSLAVIGLGLMLLIGSLQANSVF
jgi:nickel/cobalt transporter (NicO) family protein